MQLEHNVVIHRQGYNLDKRDAYPRCQKVRHPYNEVKIIFKTHYIGFLKHKNKPW